MELEEIISHARRIGEQSRRAAGSAPQAHAIKAQACEFLRTYAGPRSAFYQSATEASGMPHLLSERIAATLEAFVDYVSAGLQQGLSPERKAQLDVVSDFLQQAHDLLSRRETHPAAPAVLIGATLEEFLRTWVEAEGLSIGNRKPGIDAYAQALRDAGHLSKQDVKDITSWAGTRNHAAHGEWEEVGGRDRVQLMLEGVNLFLQKHTP